MRAWKLRFSELRPASSAGFFAGFVTGALAMVVFLDVPFVLTVCLADFVLAALPVLPVRPFSVFPLEPVSYTHL
ncbi:hypothetical protein, partial [Rhizobium leguminosarum]|uniref:hypothetical protein n=1 Tax=Rhizobium leguminosarum TaxID=384 RepID=UPI002795733B